MDWQQHIISDKNILLGKPTIKGPRIYVELILELLSDSWDEKIILESYPNVTEKDLKAVYAFLNECIKHELFFSIPKPA